MHNKSIPRVVVSGLRGGGGKTILSLSLVSSLRKKGIKVIPFKKGPDYIDAGWLCLFYFIRIVLPRYIQISFQTPVHQSRQLLFIFCLGSCILAGFIFYQVNDWLASREISRMSDEFDIARAGREQGQFIRDMFLSLPELPSLGVTRAGGTKYSYPGEVVDLMGINNLLMAHNEGSRVGQKNQAAFEKKTFYQLQPDLMSAEIVSNKKWEYNESDLKKSWNNTVALKGLYDDAAFLDLYVYAKINRNGNEMEKALVAWFHRDFLDELESSGFFVIEKYEYAHPIE